MPEADTSKTALYRLYGGDGRLLYIGISDQLGTRWEQHLRSKPWWPEVQRMTSEWYADRGTAAVAEIAAIEREHPTYNIRHAGGPTTVAVSVRDVERLAASVEQMQRALSKFEGNLGLRPRQSQKKTRPVPIGEAMPIAGEQAEKLLTDMAQVLGEERVRLSAVPHLLRVHHPDSQLYRGLSGRDIAKVLRTHGIRFTNTHNIPRLDPKDLPQSNGGDN